MLESIGDQQSDDVFVAQPEFTRPGDINDLALLHLNTSTGIDKTIAQLRVAQVRNGAQE